MDVLAQLVDGKAAAFGFGIAVVVCVGAAVWWRMGRLEQRLDDHEGICEQRTGEIFGTIREARAESNEADRRILELLGELRADMGYLRGKADVES